VSKLLEEKLTEWTLWYNYNLKVLPKADLIKRAAFHEKAVTGALECLLIAARDIKELEGAKRQLFLPSGLTLVDDYGRPMSMRIEDE